MWAALGSMIIMMVVLSVDNIVLASTISGRMPPAQQYLARKLGLVAATGTRVLLLLFVAQLDASRSTLITVAGHGFGVRDLLFVSGGIYLVISATREIHKKPHRVIEESARFRAGSILMAVVQIAVVDLVVSVDNVVTLIGMSSDSNLAVMIAALLVSGFVMLVAEGPVSEFITKRPTMRMLTLSMLLLIGMAMVAEGMGQDIQKDYIYLAMGFSVLIEMINLRFKKTPGRERDGRELKAQIPWLRVFAGGMVIVGSILLAFGIQAWWDGVQEAESLQQTLTSLEAAFVENVEGIDEQLDVSDDFRDRLETFFGMSPSDALTMPEDSAHLILTSVYRPVTASLNNEYLSQLVDAADLSSQPILQDHVARWRRDAFLLRERRAVLVDLEQQLLRASGHYPEMGPHLRGLDRPHSDAHALALLRDDPEVVALATTKASSWRVYRSYFVLMREGSGSILGLIRRLQAQ